MKTFKIVFIIFIILGLLLSITYASEEDDKKLAYKAFRELKITGYEVLNVEYKHLMSGTESLYITAVHDSGKQMYFILERQKSIFWEKHKWRVFTAFEL